MVKESLVLRCFLALFPEVGPNSNVSSQVCGPFSTQRLTGTEVTCPSPAMMAGAFSNIWFSLSKC